MSAHPSRSLGFLAASALLLAAGIGSASAQTGASPPSPPAAAAPATGPAMPANPPPTGAPPASGNVAGPPVTPPPAGVPKQPPFSAVEAAPPATPPKQQLSIMSAVPGVSAGRLLRVPVSHLIPGDFTIDTGIKNPLANDPSAVQRGMQDFIHFNCVGCHANNGAGGIGPSLSNEIWIYGSSPANIFLTIYQGRPNGMPAWGNILPTTTIWELVSYVESIWKRPGSKFGITTSLNPPSPAIQQVPAEILQTTDPWAHVEPFSNGQKPASQGGTASIK